MAFEVNWQKLAKSKKYREEFVGAFLKRSVPFQVRTLRRKLELSQEELAQRANLTQGVISRAEDPNYGNLSFKTVVRIAAGFDLAFIGQFVPFSDLVRRAQNLSEDQLNIPVFDVENCQIEERLKAGRLAKVVSIASGQGWTQNDPWGQSGPAPSRASALYGWKGKQNEAVQR